MLKTIIIIICFLLIFASETEQEINVTKESSVNICNLCDCINPVVDCGSRGLSTVNYRWPKWRNSIFYLDFNFFTHLTKFPEANASFISFAYNRIKFIEEKAFENLEFLVYLNLSNNYLTELSPEVFYGQYDIEYYHPLKLLRILDLSYNEIRSLHYDSFIHLPNLEILNLSHNPIKVIDDNTRMALSKISFIKVLDLSFTGIAELPEYFLHNSIFLKVLNLEYNNFTEIPRGFLKDGHDLVYIKLEYNPVKSTNNSKRSDTKDIN